MQLNIYQLDAFTDKLFGGNSAAVIPLHTWLDDALMQKIGLENNLSETAFFISLPDGRYHIRWFSPLCEIPFCGHATLASAKVLFDNNPEINEITFYAKAVGDIVINKDGDLIKMRFPHREAQPIAQIPKALTKGLSIAPQEVLRNEQAYFAIYDNPQAIYDVVPDCALLISLAPYDVVVTAAAKNQKYDIISRYFWSSSGGLEDPVTGSIHAGLAPYWSEKLNKKQLHARQASSRIGDLYCDVFDDYVMIAGQAVHYMTGQIYLED